LIHQSSRAIRIDTNDFPFGAGHLVDRFTDVDALRHPLSVNPGYMMNSRVNTISDSESSILDPTRQSMESTSTPKSQQVTTWLEDPQTLSSPLLAPLLES
jgi:hypothetical protein